MKTVRHFLTAVACLLLVSPIVSAQTTGTIRGTITDADGKALPGVSVEATSPSLQGTRVVVTNDSGSYQIVSVPPGTYTVRASLAGFGTVEKSAIVTLDSTVTANITLQLAAKESVVVTGEAPLVDVTSTTSGTTYSEKVMEKLPLGFNYAEIVKANPGVTEDRGDTQGRALSLTIYGATSAENQYIIDGVNTTNVIRGFQGKAINGTFIQEVEVKTGGYQAEYGRAMGGVVNVITKSGGNEFHGDAFGYFDSFGTRAEQDRLHVGCCTSEHEVQWHGPGHPERYADLRLRSLGLRRGPRRLRPEGPDLVLRGVRPGRVPESDRFAHGPPRRVSNATNFPLEQTENLYSGKLTFNITQGTTLTGSDLQRSLAPRGGAGFRPANEPSDHHREQ